MFHFYSYINIGKSLTKTNNNPYMKKKVCNESDIPRQRNLSQPLKSCLSTSKFGCNITSDFNIENTIMSSTKKISVQKDEDVDEYINKSGPLTRRKCLSICSGLYDPTSHLNSVNVTLRLLSQSCKKNISLLHLLCLLLGPFQFWIELVFSKIIFPF